MSRLISFGCSYTYGSALPDTWTSKTYPRSRVPSSYAWPKLLGDKLNYEVLNLGFGGSGNLEILWKIMSTNLKHDDLVVVLWTHFTRLHNYKFADPKNLDPVIERNPKYIEYKKSAENAGYRVPMDRKALTEDLGYDLATRNYLTMSHGSLFLKNKGIRAYHILATDEYTFSKHENIVIENFLDIKPNDWHIDKALDNMHPGVESQKLLTTLIYDKIKDYELR